MNALENLAVFAPVVIAAVLMGTTGGTVLLAVKDYVFARVIHYIVYTAGIPVARTLSFVTNPLCHKGRSATCRSLVKDRRDIKAPCRLCGLSAIDGSLMVRTRVAQEQPNGIELQCPLLGFADVPRFWLEVW